MIDCQAKQVYEFTRGKPAYNIAPPYIKRRNQHATSYIFPDGSKFIQYRDYNRRAWANGPDTARCNVPGCSVR
jgi:hypothetical protein